MHTVRLEHPRWLGKAVVTVEGDTVYYRPRRLVAFGWRKSFHIDGVECLVRVIPTPWFTWWFWFWVDGRKHPQPNKSQSRQSGPKIPLIQPSRSNPSARTTPTRGR